MDHPVVSRRLRRVLVSLVFLLLAGFGLQFVMNSASQATASSAVKAPDGEKLYVTRCMSCHQMNGQGVPGVFPPLDGSEWVTGDKGRLTRVILHGLTGPIEVDGVKYTGAMPPWGGFMSDEEVAALSNFIRNSWSNEAEEELSVAEVAAVRAAHSDRKKPWTEAELAEEANRGIPSGK